MSFQNTESIVVHRSPHKLVQGKGPIAARNPEQPTEALGHSTDNDETIGILRLRESSGEGLVRGEFDLPRRRRDAEAVQHITAERGLNILWIQPPLLPMPIKESDVEEDRQRFFQGHWQVVQRRCPALNAFPMYRSESSARCDFIPPRGPERHLGIGCQQVVKHNAIARRNWNCCTVRVAQAEITCWGGTNDGDFQRVSLQEEADKQASSGLAHQDLPGKYNHPRFSGG